MGRGDGRGVEDAPIRMGAGSALAHASGSPPCHGAHASGWLQARGNKTYYPVLQVGIQGRARTGVPARGPRRTRRTHPLPP